MKKEIPNGWEQKKLKYIGIFSKGKGIPGYSYVDCGEPCIGYGDIYTTYNIQFNKSIHFTDEKTAKTGKLANQGTLMFTASGETAEEIGKCVCYTGKDPLYVGGDVIMFNTENVNPVFLAYQQNIWDFIKEKARYGQGHSVVHIHESELGELNCLYPKERKEQDKIVEVLDAWAKAVELQEQKVEKLKEKKKALMQKLLTPKEDWGGVKLGEICDCYQSQTITQNQFTKSGFKVYGANGFIGYYDKYNHEEWQVVLSCRGNCGTINRTEDKAWINGNAMVLNLKDEGILDKDYFYYQCQATSFKDIIDDSGIPQIISISAKNKILKYEKNKTKQRQYADFFANIDKKLVLEEELLNKYKMQQKALMQKLLTGEIRV